MGCDLLSLWIVCLMLRLRFDLDSRLLIQRIFQILFCMLWQKKPISANRFICQLRVVILICFSGWGGTTPVRATLRWLPRSAALCQEWRFQATSSLVFAMKPIKNLKILFRWLRKCSTTRPSCSLTRCVSALTLIEEWQIMSQKTWKKRGWLSWSRHSREINCRNKRKKLVIIIWWC